MVYYEIHTKGWIHSLGSGDTVTVGKNADDCNTMVMPVEQVKVGDWLECGEYEPLEKVKRIVATLDFKEWEKVGE